MKCAATHGTGRKTIRKDIDYVKRRPSYGIQRIVDKFIAEGLPIPKWELVSDGVCVTVWKKEIQTDQETDQETDDKIRQTTDIENNNKSDKVSFTDQESDQEKDKIAALLAVLGNNPLSIKEIMELLNLSHVSHFRQNYLNPAIKLGFVKMTHPENPRHRDQRYYKESGQESEQVKSLLAVLKDKPLTIKEIMELLNLSHVGHFRQNYLNPAIKLGFVKMTHPENPKHRNQRYYKVNKL